LSTGAILFMAASWAGVLGLVSWSYYRILTNRRHHDPDGLGPQAPPVPPRGDRPR
jgi:hypothetical protein